MLAAVSNIRSVSSISRVSSLCNVSRVSRVCFCRCSDAALSSAKLRPPESRWLFNHGWMCLGGEGGLETAEKDKRWRTNGSAEGFQRRRTQPRTLRLLHLLKASSDKSDLLTSAEGGDLRRVPHRGLREDSCSTRRVWRTSTKIFVLWTSGKPPRPQPRLQPLAVAF